ncbi:dTDP-4-dehydrorhamnose reductase [Ralstonia sp. NFACC01]|uniref:dTDP-4-dehydrorhamnose reductase n=1 Tax=Ralstonia sp. NFACC01 TaxID=1566294 RepID=UPI0008EA9B0D|nr:dTDP-4-dehydrorhamnose reductase [Ralstonia sp. NFACC01]SFP43653.1 dTDP-4-dehydrorhamnose reductase [Ralstonia sp. NFACC01]
MRRKLRSLPSVLITGCNGQIGFELRRRLAPVGRVVALDRAACDLSQTDAIRKAMRTFRPDIVVNAAGYTDVDKAEADAELAFAINSTAVGVLAQECVALQCLLIHYSTDYVFDGNKQLPYVETDVANPGSIYGKSKLAGEEAIARSEVRALTLRTGWVAGAHGDNFVKRILKQGCCQQTLSVVADRFGTPTTAPRIANVTADLVRKYCEFEDQRSFPFGLYHLAASGQTDWHTYAVEILTCARARGIALRAQPEQVIAVSAMEYPRVAPRPRNSCLDATKIQRVFGIQLPEWKIDVHDVLDEVFQRVRDE